MKVECKQESQAALEEQQQRNPYHVISFEKRMQLLEIVCVEGNSIPKSAQKLEIKLSTAKYIVRSFLRKGTVMKKLDSETIDEQEMERMVIQFQERVKSAGKMSSRMKKDTQRKQCIQGKKVKRARKRKNKKISAHRKLQEKNQQNLNNSRSDIKLQKDVEKRQPVLPSLRTDYYYYPQYICFPTYQWPNSQIYP